jgi:hypothetical protein
MESYKALVPPPPALEERNLRELCPDYVAGYCINDCHPTTHQIFRICGTEGNRVRLCMHANFLTAHHHRLKSKDPYDSDGAGRHSLAGPRHDNDYEDIQDIKILPTIDEVCISKTMKPSTDSD